MVFWGESYLLSIFEQGKTFAVCDTNALSLWEVKGGGWSPLIEHILFSVQQFFSVHVLGFAFIPTARVLTIVARVDFSGSSFVPPSPPCSLIYRCVCMCVFTDGAFLPVFERLKKETKNG